MDIPEGTMSAMWKFFMKTTVPRLIEKKRKEQEDKPND